MKEAAGEANMTVITIVLIAIVLAVGTVIVNNLMSSNKKSSCCSANGGVWNGGVCYHPSACNQVDGSTVCEENGQTVPADNCSEASAPAPAGS